MSSLFGKKEKVRCSHILVKEESEAQKLLQELKAGADFAQKARQLSQCPSGKQSGGDLGSFARGAMVKEFDAVAFQLTPGQLSDVVKTKFGYHILLRTE